MDEGKSGVRLQQARLLQAGYRGVMCRGLTVTATAFAFLFFGSLSSGTHAQSGAEAINQGRAIAQKFCARCHAIDAGDRTKSGAASVSPHREAPPFRIIASKYPLENLEEAFAEGIAVGHADMPEFQLEPNEIGALLSYMDSISR